MKSRIPILAVTTSLWMTSIAASIQNALRGCEHDGTMYPPSSKFMADPCTRCWCPRRGGTAQCVVEDCGFEPHCVAFRNSSRDQCCPQCVEYGCRNSDGKLYREGEVIREEACARCFCPVGGGDPVCDVTSCPLSECVDPVHVPGVCCPICPNGPNCQIGLFTLPIGQSVIIEGANCTCEKFLDSDRMERTLARCNKF